MPEYAGAYERLRAIAASAIFTALAGCTVSGPRTPPPPARPEAVVEAPPPAANAPSRESQAVRRYFADLQSDLLGRGLLRRDGGGADTPWGPRELTENFIRIALYDEYSGSGSAMIARETPTHLRRWQQPVRIGLRFGASVAPEQQARDRASVANYAATLARASGHPVRLSDQNPNFWLYILSEDERTQMGPEWSALFPGLPADTLTVATKMPLSTVCMVLAISESSSPIYNAALAVVRAELPDLLRLSCLHEELAQGLGLANDYASARPSIFNDDEEFATLTRMDEVMLGLLYDKRLKPGMTARDVRPLLPELISERLPGGS